MHNQVIWINRLLQPNKFSTIARNKTYLSYIAEKENVFRNESTEHGLWGYIRDIPDIDKNNSLTEVHEYIRQLSLDKKNIFRGIISISEADAMEKGFDKKEQWEDLIKVKLPEFAKSINIPSERLEYVASIHRDKGHPHIHIMFWDREQEIQKRFIHKSISNKFRISLNKYIFNEEYTEALKQRDAIKEDFITEEKQLESLFINELLGKNTQIETISTVDFYYPETMYLDRISKEDIDEITNQLLGLREELPKTGSIDYKYLMKDEDLIKKIDDISRRILQASPSLKKEFDKYIKKSVEIAEISGNAKKEDIEKVKELAEKDLLKQIGNKVLNIERQVIRQEEISERERIKFQNNLLQGFSELICLFSQLNQSNDYHIKGRNQHNELTSEARKELAKKLQDKGAVEW